ncbi:MAG: endoribonuclease MazF [Betaproteobacteria bacterium]|nr:endoribonuclease MazF [Betaproteobacteria bacterium]
MARRSYVPDRGDIVWLNFTPHAGHEQAGHRPALVLSPAKYNRASGLMLCCPMTTQIKGYPFEVPVESPGGARGVVLADQVKSVDWQARRAQRKGRAAGGAVTDVLARIQALLR